MRRPVHVLTSLLLAVALVSGACSGDDDTTSPDTTEPAGTPTTGAPEVGGDASATTTLPAGSGEFESEAVEFSTPDGVLLAGTLFSSGSDGSGAIVLAHMRGADRSTWEPFAEVAAGNGFRVLTFDFRGYGDSDGERDTLLDVDLTAAVEHLERDGAESVVVMGASMGGTAAINVASKLDLAGAASLSAPADFQGLPALDVAADVDEPLLLIVAEDDQPYAGAAVSISETAPDNRLETFEGGAHGTNLFSDHPDDLAGALLTFAGDPAGSI